MRSRICATHQRRATSKNDLWIMRDSKMKKLSLFFVVALARNGKNCLLWRENNKTEKKKTECKQRWYNRSSESEKKNWIFPRKPYSKHRCCLQSFFFVLFTTIYSVFFFNLYIFFLFFVWICVLEKILFSNNTWPFVHGKSFRKCCGCEAFNFRPQIQYIFTCASSGEV